MWKMVSIVNKNTNQQVLNEKLDRELNLDKCEFEVNKPLKIVYSNGVFFSHELVKDVICDTDIICVITSKKIWNLVNDYDGKLIK